MPTATLGGLIKDHRLKKRLSQLEVSRRIGWSDATRLSKIEQGRVNKPTRSTLNKIMDALELDDHQKGEMLKVGTRIPEKKESAAMIKKLVREISNVRYPVLIVDTFWTTYYVNDQFIKVFDLSKECIAYIEKNNPNWIEILFLTNFIKSNRINAGSNEKFIFTDYKKYQVMQFKFEMKDYLNESWFLKLLRSLMKSEEFKILWDSIPTKVESNWYDYEFYKILNTDVQLSFHVCTMRPVIDPRFNYIMHFPADSKTIDYFN